MPKYPGKKQSLEHLGLATGAINIGRRPFSEGVKAEVDPTNDEALLPPDTYIYLILPSSNICLPLFAAMYSLVSPLVK